MDRFWKLNRYFLLIIALFSVLLQSCEEEEDIAGQLTIIDGQVTDYYTNIGIRNVMLLFINEDSNTDPFALTYTYYDTIYADTLGRYHYEFINDTLRTYLICPKSPERYAAFNSRTAINEGELNTCNFRLKAFRSLKFHVVNKEKKWEKCHIYNYQTIGENFQKFLLSGGDIDTLLDIKIIPESYNSLGISLTIGNNTPVDEYKSANMQFYSSSNSDTTMTFTY